MKAVKQRLNVSKYNNALLIDDTYNANPNSMKSAFELLNTITLFKQKIAVLGDMFELGEKTTVLHKNLAKEIIKNKIDTVLTIGENSQQVFNALQGSKVNSVHFANRNSLNKFLQLMELNDSAILVKGSRGMKMEEFVQTIKERFIK